MSGTEVLIIGAGPTGLVLALWLSKLGVNLRIVDKGQGGVEEFFNLNIVAKHVRLQGLMRATQYGYSLWEVEFKTPGSDNTIPEQPTSAQAFPANGNGWTPLPGSNDAIESLQFTLPDGTLVTRFGARVQDRHGRERGEEWNEIGSEYPNETVNPATGMAFDKGPGNHLTFVPLYYKNRTWGVEIIDNSRVAGVTKPQLVVNQYTQVDFRQGEVAFFRGFDRVGLQAVLADAIGIGVVGLHGQDAGRAHLCRLFDDEVGAGLLDRREHQPQVGRVLLDRGLGHH